jgi:hypothetical protein
MSREKEKMAKVIGSLESQVEALTYSLKLAKQHIRQIVTAYELSYGEEAKENIVTDAITFVNEN